MVAASVGVASPSGAAPVDVAAVQQADHAAGVHLVSVVPATVALCGVTVVAGSVCAARCAGGIAVAECVGAGVGRLLVAL